MPAPESAEPHRPASGRSRKPSGRGRRRLAVALLVVGVAALAEAAVTVLWQEPFSALYTAGEQSRLEEELRALERDRLSPAEARRLERSGTRPTPLAEFAASLERRVRPGHAIGRITIARLDLDAPVVQGANPRTLRSGPGHYRGTALPGEPGTVGLAGHRTTYSAPFRHLDDLRRGDQIVVRMPYGRFGYEVSRTGVAPPNAVGVLADARDPRLVLTTCHPVHTAEQRLVVYAKLVSRARLGTARRSRTSCVGNGCPEEAS